MSARRELVSDESAAEIDAGRVVRDVLRQKRELRRGEGVVEERIGLLHDVAVLRSIYASRGRQRGTKQPVREANGVEEVLIPHQFDVPVGVQLCLGSREIPGRVGEVKRDHWA